MKRKNRNKLLMVTLELSFVFFVYIISSSLVSTDKKLIKLGAEIRVNFNNNKSIKTVMDVDNIINKKNIYNNPKDLIKTYYNIINLASGKEDSSYKDIYAYSYDLISNDYKYRIPLKEYIDSFADIGGVELVSIYKYNEYDNNIDYFVEIKVYSDTEYVPKYMTYYYGVITTSYDDILGYNIDNIVYFPEDIKSEDKLYYDVDYFMDEVYKKNDIIEGIYDIKEENNIKYIFAKYQNDLYRFDFIKLNNGEIRLLHQYIKENNTYKEVDLLNDEYKYIKISINN